MHFLAGAGCQCINWAFGSGGDVVQAQNCLSVVLCQEPAPVDERERRSILEDTALRCFPQFTPRCGFVKKLQGTAAVPVRYWTLSEPPDVGRGYLASWKSVSARTRHWVLL